ncbi:saccharopine dehydrogenase NADP-binding domain-containing protein [Rhodococcus sp. BP-252]|uniref:saccharopine dehydrogenase family protein n=1 Tax=unclassified Rhodococcus (in: high G+C Gram-positive bacteria) TaxID=192944 RepID=UPI001C9ADB0A|nr:MULTISPECIES: saccharopine dehydrogenase NADP-binding domain-containing protein [unclassified Rhodococcus (in: high G+C Gram-positive bacteria)]MBY6410033.1 saccharopine dehydrogenase NADP-binding domain-containing protein [Rhodococcus sp. BP-320]MBY6415002.1 saccharopine dehydrogenase NADP-binding domain-containing protein [Rhodococcus sp. BP-321]MBY6421295.1 saccharopine dehydrogenase NADP-binding domain-containing protein [Rhodococcus sp. BP-324]MBY6425690.1 saccharopine dehydrogenase NAD
MTSSREHDIVVYGATGFVGKLTAAYLASHAPANTSIALAGRSLSKLEEVRRSLPASAAEWPLIQADAADTDALRAMAESTRVVITTVGPYAKYGLPLTTACAEAGTDYVDLTGEVLFTRESIDTNEEIARRTGARIVHACGFDSIPSDLGVHVLHAAVAADGAGEMTDTTLVVTSMRGGVSGGTIDSLRTQIEVVKKDKKLRRLAASPYTLSPDRSREPDLGRQSDVQLVDGKDIAPGVKGWKAPFVMASANTRVVRRSNALRDWAYGRKFRYREVMSVGSSVASPLVAGAVSAGLGAMVFAMTVAPKKLLDRVLVAPGSGPSTKAQENGHFTVDIYTTTTTGARYRSRVKAKGDPGYKATSVMLSESALALAFDRDRLPDAAGVLTPATAIGDALVTRLRDAGFEIRAEKA